MSNGVETRTINQLQRSGRDFFKDVMFLTLLKDVMLLTLMNTSKKNLLMVVMTLQYSLSMVNKRFVIALYGLVGRLYI